MGTFQNLMQETLASILTRKEWAEYLRVDEIILENWTWGLLYPRPEQVNKIIWIHNHSDGGDIALARRLSASYNTLWIVTAHYALWLTEQTIETIQ